MTTPSDNARDHKFISVSTGATYELYPLPTDPLPDSEVADYRAWRLTALRLDPSAFTSKYEKESTYGEEKWRDVLKDGRISLVARVSAKTDSTESGAMVGGIAVMPGPVVTSMDGLPLETELDKTYYIFRMWVHPDHRRRGLGRALVERALAWIKEDAALKGNADAEVWIAAITGNEPARSLYERAGFMVRPDVVFEEEGSEKLWMKYVF